MRGHLHDRNDHSPILFMDDVGVDEMTRFDEVARLREGTRYPPDAKCFQDEQPEGEMIQVSPGCYEGGIDGYALTGEVLIVKSPSDPECYPETVANFDHPEDATNYVALRNAAPWLLEVAACFQPGDADRIQTVLWALNDPMWASYVEALTRLQKAAAIMERGR